ncbi:MAG: hypothetical protein Q7S37_05050 [bacterium]|nr:hypothetical protein [bacterium]
MKLNKLINETKGKYFRKFDPEMVHFYRTKMPKKLNVKIHQDENCNKYWAEIDFDGKSSKDKIFTQAKNLNNIDTMINDAIATYYEVPFIYAKHIVISKNYEPEGKLKETLRTT